MFMMLLLVILYCYKMQWYIGEMLDHADIEYVLNFCLNSKYKSFCKSFCDIDLLVFFCST